MSEVTKGVKYLKINRLDAGGGDCSSKILNADNIRINYPDVGSVLYDILSIQQQSDYYLIGIINQPITSSNPGRFGFGLRASASYNVNNLSTTPTWSGTGGTTFFFNIGSGSGGSNVTGDASPIFQTGSSNTIPTAYVFKSLPNEKFIVQFTCSIKNSNGGVSAPFTASLRLPMGGLVNIASASLPPNSTTSFSGSVTSIDITNAPGVSGVNNNTYFYIQGINTSNILSLTASYAELNVIAAPTSTQTSFINISPDTTNFANSDDNAIINNIVIPQYSTIYQDIDYSIGLVPTNFNLLASGSATYATVQDSNYTSTGWTNSRYKGSRASSPDFNVTT
jgi:hypothetical protein